MDKNNENANFIDKKQFSISIIFLTFLVITLFGAIFFSLNNKITNLHKEDTNVDVPVFNESVTETPTKDTYMIKEFDGKIGVYKNGDFQYYIDVYVFTLPENEQKLLYQGITTSSEQELSDILSSYY